MPKVEICTECLAIILTETCLIHAVIIVKEKTDHE